MFICAHRRVEFSVGLHRRTCPLPQCSLEPQASSLRSAPESRGAAHDAAIASSHPERSSVPILIASPETLTKSRRLALRSSFFLLAYLLFFLEPSAAQSDRATIEGRIVDASGDAIAAASVQLIHIETDDILRTSTDANGIFSAQNLSIGTYAISVTKQGFQSLRRDGLELHSQANIRVDITLPIALLKETITVTTAPLLDPSGASLTTTLTADQVNGLPVINIGAKRNIGQYLPFLPGVNNPSTWGARVNGANGGNTEIFLDGAPSSQGNARGSNQETGPDVETVQEVSVVTGAFSAEYGRTGIWFTNVVLKSGTNTFHGSVYDHLVNDAFNARSFFQSQRDRVRQNDAGFTLGGPLLMSRGSGKPHRTFFFAAQELFSYQQVGSSSLATAPAAALRRGDFSNYRDASGAVIPIYDPASTAGNGQGGYSRRRFASNLIPASQISAISQQMVQLIPSATNDSQEYNFLPRAENIFHNRVTTVKLDRTLTDNQRLSLTTILQDRPAEWTFRGWGLGLPIDGTQNPKNVQSFDSRLNYDYIIRPNLLNHFTIGGDGMSNRAFTSSLGQHWDARLGITGLPADPGMFPTVDFSGGTAPPLGLGGTNYSKNVSSRFSLNDLLSWIVGSHATKFGINIIRERYADFEGGGASGIFNFINLSTSDPSSPAFSLDGSSFASFLLGAVDSTSTTTTSGLGWRINYQSAFFQDEWRATPALTFSYGLRWERFPGIYEEHDRATSLGLTTPNPGAGGLPGALTFAGTGPGRTGRRTFSRPWSGVAPRLGVAYEVLPKTVIRMSTGVFYAPGMTPRIDATGFAATPSFSSPDGFTPAYYWQNSWPTNWTRPPVLNSSFANGQSVSTILSNASRAPQTISWTVGLHRQFMRDITAEADYIGNSSTHLELGPAALGMPDITTYLNVLPTRYLALGNLLNQPIDSSAAIAAGIKSPFSGFSQLPNHTVGQALRPFPQYTNVTMPYSPEGISSYHAFQVKVSKRYAAGLTLVGFYTYSRLMTNDDCAAIDLGEGAGNIQNPGNRRGEYSVSQDDYPHTFGFTFLFELPFGPNKRYLRNTGLGMLFAHWKLSGSLQRQSGQALSITAGSVLAQFGFPVIRANYVANQNPYASHAGKFDPSEDLYLNPAAFSTPAAFQLGNTSRTLGWLRGPRVDSEALSLAKLIPIRGIVDFILRADAQNPFNVTRWLNPDQMLSDAGFGRITGAQSGRIIQLSASVRF